MAHAMSEKPILREARAAVFATVCVLVGVVGHDALSLGTATSPGAVPVPILALCVGGLFLPVRFLTGRERGLPGILAALAVIQIGLHQVFAAAQQHAAIASASASGMPGRALPAIGSWWCGPQAPRGLNAMLVGYGYPASGMRLTELTGDMISMPSMPSMTSMPSMPSMPSMTHSMGAGMLAAHIAAALVAAWWLRRGEAAAWTLARAITACLVVPLSRLAAAVVPWTPPKPVPAAFAAVDRPGPGLLIRFAVARRGPPRGSAAFR